MEFARDTIEINCTQKSQIWMDLRACLVTASSVGTNDLSFNKLHTKFDWFINADSETLTGRMAWKENGSPLDWVKCIKYGVRHEDTARDDYSAFLRANGTPHDMKVDVGISIDPDGMFGASPDGIVVDRINEERGVVEIKCPSGGFFKMNPTWDVEQVIPKESVESTNVSTLPKWAQQWVGTSTIPKGVREANRPYYDQCIVNMYVQGAKWVDFVVWQPHQKWGVRGKKWGAPTPSFGIERIDESDQTESDFKAIVARIDEVYKKYANEFRDNRIAFLYLYRENEAVPDYDRYREVVALFEQAEKGFIAKQTVGVDAAHDEKVIEKIRKEEKKLEWFGKTAEPQGKRVSIKRKLE